MNPTDLAGLAELQRLLDAAYAHHFAAPDACGGKRDEGRVAVWFNTYYDRAERRVALEVTGVQVYSYLLGPNRNHDFETVAEALYNVRHWHDLELRRTHDGEADEYHGPEWDAEPPQSFVL